MIKDEPDGVDMIKDEPDDALDQAALSTLPQASTIDFNSTPRLSICRKVILLAL